MAEEAHYDKAHRACSAGLAVLRAWLADPRKPPSDKSLLHKLMCALMGEYVGVPWVGKRFADLSVCVFLGVLAKHNVRMEPSGCECDAAAVTEHEARAMEALLTVTHRDLWHALWTLRNPPMPEHQPTSSRPETSQVS